MDNSLQQQLWRWYEAPGPPLARDWPSRTHCQVSMSRLAIDRLRQQQQQQQQQQHQQPPSQHRVIRRRTAASPTPLPIKAAHPQLPTRQQPQLHHLQSAFAAAHRDDSLTSGIVSDESCSIVAGAGPSTGGPSVRFGDTFVHLIPSRSDENGDEHSLSSLSSKADSDKDDGVDFEEVDDEENYPDDKRKSPAFVDIDVDAVAESETERQTADQSVLRRVATDAEASQRFYRLCYNLDSGSASSSCRGSLPEQRSESLRDVQDDHSAIANPSGKCMRWLQHQHQGSQQPQLPDRVLLLAFSYLDSPQLCRCASVCRSWYRLAWHPALWTGLELLDPRLDANAAIDSVTKILSYASYPYCLGLLRVSVANSVTLTDRALSLLGSRCPQLQRAEFRACPRLTGLGARELLHGCRRLRRLRLVACHGITLALPVTAPRLDHLEVADCRSVGDSSLRALGDGMCPRLVRLSLRSCPEVSDDGLAALGAGGCPGLRELRLVDLSCCVGEAGLDRLLRRCGRRLRRLALVRCEGITDPVLFNIATRAPNLRQLSLRECRRVTDLGLERLARGLGPAGPPFELDASGCDITDDAVVALAASGGCAARLVRLCLRGCDCVTDQGLSALIAHGCPRLAYLNLLGCSVSPHAVLSARSSLPPSTVVHFSLA